MPTPAQLNEQYDLERRQIKGGLDKLSKDTRTLEQKEYASATVYGRCSIDQLLPTVIEAIDIKFNKAKITSTGYQKNLLHNHVMILDSQSSAAIAVKRFFDKVFSFKKGDSSVTKISEAIGRAIEAEAQMRHYETEAPALLHVLKERYWHESKGTEQRLTSIQTVINRYDINKWDSWGVATNIKVGGWFADVICESTNWFTKETIHRRKSKETIIVPTDAFIENKDEIIRVAELFSPLTLPMFIEPRDWSNTEDGGYYLNSLTNCHKLVRRTLPLTIQGRTPLTFLNKIQKVGYRLNPFIIKVAETLDEKGIAVGKFRPIIEHPLPNKPVDIETNTEAKQAYRRLAAQVHDKRNQEFRKSCRTRMTMNAIREFKERDRYYIPWSFDYRGRTYPIPSFLTPQDSDFGKSLIRFADEGEINEGWLAFQVATTYGLDKETIEKRKEWTRNNHSLITRIVKDPIGNIGSWEVADEPFQFLAACEEYYSCVISQSRSTTGLCVAIDATCSGLQILAGLAMDRRTAQLVNVLPSDRPQDAYAKVAEAAKPHIPEYLHKVWDRKSVKRTVMTIPYNAKPYSNRSYIRDALKEKGIDIENEDLTVVVNAVREAMHKEFPGPMKVMKWIEDEVSKAIKRGKTEITWTTPSGFRVVQRLMKPNCKYIYLRLLGKCKVWANLGDSDEVDSMHHKNATAPNLIHSLDASLLHIAATKFDNPIALIHDSVLCRASDMDELSNIVRETYMHLFAEHEYLTRFAQHIGAETPPPIIGDLEPSDVIDSTYFFC